MSIAELIGGGALNHLPRLALLNVFVGELCTADHESFVGIATDADGRLIALETKTSCHSSMVGVEFGPIVARASYAGARNLIVLHNHPSGIARPSDADIAFTRHMVTLANAFGIDLLDHVIVSRDAFFSFREEGLL